MTDSLRITYHERGKPFYIFYIISLQIEII